MLVLAMLLVVVGGIMIYPLLDYGTGLIRQSRVAHSKVSRVEAVKSGLRMALADPMQLYRTCGGTNVAAPVSLDNSGIAVPVATSCAQVAASAATDSGRYATALVGAGVPLAAELSRRYPYSASNDTGRWIADASTVPAADRVWSPDLPVHDLSSRQAAGWQMPSSYGDCTVFFPGTYSAPLTLNQNRSYYFTSGVYYFSNPVTITNPAQVVIGSGSVKGCATDQEAAFDAVGAPVTHAITGAGATFVFGGGGRLLVQTVSNIGAVRVQFNQRYVDPADVNGRASAGVSIMTVNGRLSAAGTLQDHEIVGKVRVPFSMVSGTTRRPATEQAYAPSTLVPSTTQYLTEFDPVLAVTVRHNIPYRLAVPGYVAVPQGRVDVRLELSAVTADQADVLFEGGVLATSVTVGMPRPRTLRFDIVLPVVQRTFQITTATTSGLPVVRSTALVQVNQNGAYAVNSWVVS